MITEKKIESVIEKGVPIPQNRQRYSGILTLLRTMEIGDSFFLSPPDNGRSLRSMTHYYSRILNKKYVVRVVDGGVRCWRVK